MNKTKTIRIYRIDLISNQNNNVSGIRCEASTKDAIQSPKTAISSDKSILFNQVHWSVHLGMARKYAFDNARKNEDRRQKQTKAPNIHFSQIGTDRLIYRWKDHLQESRTLLFYDFFYISFHELGVNACVSA